VFSNALCINESMRRSGSHYIYEYIIDKITIDNIYGLFILVDATVLREPPDELLRIQDQVASAVFVVHNCG
jgi:hypothetical protein